MLAGVVTTVGPPTAAMRRVQQAVSSCGGVLVVAGDRKGPEKFDLPDAVFLGLRDQLEGPFELARRLPTDHYARKNIGYLEAVRRGATFLYETDDDNAPLDAWAPRSEEVSGARTIPPPSAFQHFSVSAFSQKWVNVYRCFTDDPHIWPRGFPLEQIRASASAFPAPRPRGAPDSHASLPNQASPQASLLCPSAYSVVPICSPIQQGLVNGSPDVDAVWRLTQDRPFTFDHRPPVWLAPGQWCPFNTQSTWWWPAAFPLLYVPSHCSFRMCDIWKSFVAQRCLWAMGLGVVFHPPEVVQDRNPHDVLKDFEAEVPGYLWNARIARLLGALELDAAPEAVGENLRVCYRALVGEGILPTDELPLLDAWLSDLAAIKENRG